MIPVVTLNDKGEVIGQQAFNDNMTVVEQIGRVMLDTLFCSQQKLTNDKDKLDKILMSGECTDAKMAEYHDAAVALNKAVVAAVAAFEKAIAE